MFCSQAFASGGTPRHCEHRIHALERVDDVHTRIAREQSHADEEDHDHDQRLHVSTRPLCSSAWQCAPACACTGVGLGPLSTHSCPGPFPVCGGTHSPLSTPRPLMYRHRSSQPSSVKYKGPAAVHKAALSGPGRARSQLGRVSPNVPHRLCGAAHVTAQPGRTITGHVHTTTCQAALGIRRTSVCAPVCARVRLRVHALVCALVCARLRWGMG